MENTLLQDSIDRVMSKATEQEKELIHSYQSVSSLIDDIDVKIEYAQRMEIGKRCKRVCNKFKVPLMNFIYPGKYSQTNFYPNAILLRVCFDVLNLECHSDLIDNFNEVLSYLSPYFKNKDLPAVKDWYEFQSINDEIGGKPSYFKICRRLESIEQDKESIILYHTEKETKATKEAAIVYTKNEI